MAHVIEQIARLQEVLGRSGWVVRYPETRRTNELKFALLWVAEREEQRVSAATKQELVRRCWSIEDKEELKAQMLNRN